MKRKKLTVFLIVFFLFTAVIGLFSVDSKATTDLSYTFEKNLFYNATNPVASFGLNVGNQTHFTEIYNGTDSFTEEVVGTQGLSIAWVDTLSGASATAEIIEDVYNHENVLQFDALVAWNKIEHDFTAKASETIEFWFMVAQTTITQIIRIKDAVDADAIYIEFRSNGELAYNDGTYHKILDYSANIWYHFKIEWDCATDWHLTLNGHTYGNYGFTGTPSTMDIFELIGNLNAVSYLDAYGEFWDADYSENDNIIPYHYLNNTLQIDRYDFYNNEDGSTTIDDQQEIPFWDEFGDASDITIIKGFPADEANDNVTCSLLADDGTVIGIERDFDIASSNIINVHTLVFYEEYPPIHDSWQDIEVFSEDGTLLVRLRFHDEVSQNNMRLHYYDGSSYIELEDCADFVLYEFNITIVDSIVAVDFLEWSDADTLYQATTYHFPVLDASKDGLGDVRFDSFTGGGGDNIFHIDYVGVYIDGISLCNDYANYFYNTSNEFDNGKHNLVYLDATGNFSLGVTELGFFPVPESFTFFNYRNSSTFTFGNFIGDSGNALEDAYVVVTTNESYSINSIRIEGVKLTDGTTDYFPTITTGNTNHNESYFYVDSSNRLNGICYYNDSNLEYIQASFDIPNALAQNRSLRLGSQFAGEYGFFSLGYTDSTSSTFSLPVSRTTHNVIITQTKTIDTFVFLITDDDELSAGFGSGRIYDLVFRWNPSISITLVTISLINIIIPLIIMIVPTLTLYSRYGKSVIMPVFIFMCIICFAGGLIPAWLFFILMIGAGGFLVLRNGGET